MNPISARPRGFQALNENFLSLSKLNQSILIIHAATSHLPQEREVGGSTKIQSWARRSKVPNVEASFSEDRHDMVQFVDSIHSQRSMSLTRDNEQGTATILSCIMLLTLIG